MFVRFSGVLIAATASCALVLAADEAAVQGTIVKVDKSKKTLTVKTDDGARTFSASKETKFFGPRGGASDDGINDDRLVPGASVRLVPTANGRWLKEVHVLAAASAKRQAEREESPTARGRKGGGEREAADDNAPASEVRGKLVKVDRARKTLTLQTESGQRTFTTGRDTKFMGPRGGASDDGIDDERLKAGAEVRIVPTTGGRAAREVHMLSVASAKAAKPTDEEKPMPSAARTTKAPPTDRTRKDAKPTDSDENMKKSGSANGKPDAKASPTHHTVAKPVDGVEGRIVAVDVDNRRFTVQLKSSGRKQEVTVAEDTQFIGPRGGVSDRGIKDDRLMPGAEVTLVFAPGGRALKEVHLPYRDDIEGREKDK